MLCRTNFSKLFLSVNLNQLEKMAYSRIANASVLGSLAKDISLPEDAQDTISSVSWSPVADHLAAASWDGKVRIYDVNAGSGAARGAALLAADGPLLDCDWAEVSS